jgi:glycosyl hydrolase family 26
MFGRKSRRSVYAVVASCSVLATLIGATSATAETTTTYLRPNADIRLGGWSVVGSYSAWDALNDNVTPSETPSSRNYVLSGSWTLRVGLSTTPIAGAKIASARAWFYSPNWNDFTVEVREGSGVVLASRQIDSPGWHSVSVPLNGGQAQLDDAHLALRGATGYGSGRASVYAALLRLRLESPDPVEPPPPAPTPTGPKVYWGSWIDGEVYGSGLGDAPWSAATWDRFEVNAGKPVSMLHFGQPAPWNQAFQPSLNEAVVKRGAIPLVDMDSDGVSSSSIASGAYDSHLIAWARAVRAYGKPFFFRWEWEMNGTWFPWGAEAARNPAVYVSAWRRFHDIAEAQGATNVTWVWCPNTVYPGSTPLASLYPGDAYVDWTCIDGYNFGQNPYKPYGWTSFRELFGPTYNALLSLAPSKPIMIGETASSEFGGSKSGWIATALESTLPNEFPRIKAIAWFNWNIFEGGGRLDWPIESSSGSREAFAKAISSPYYAGNAFGSLPPLTPIEPLP